MKNLIFTFLVVTLLFSCKEDNLTFQQQLEIDIAEIETFLADNGITNAIKDDTGVFYIIEEEGSGTAYPTVTSAVSMAYTGKFFDGTVFDSADSTNPLMQNLNFLITGWQVGVPKFKKGGKGTLYIPSGYAYGRVGNSGIPGNTNLIFDIELLNFN